MEFKLRAKHFNVNAILFPSHPYRMLRPYRCGDLNKVMKNKELQTATSPLRKAAVSRSE
jgi:hypothetical protein